MTFVIGSPISVQKQYISILFKICSLNNRNKNEENWTKLERIGESYQLQNTCTEQTPELMGRQRADYSRYKSIHKGSKRLSAGVSPEVVEMRLRMLSLRCWNDEPRASLLSKSLLVYISKLYWEVIGVPVFTHKSKLNYLINRSGIQLWTKHTFVNSTL